MCLSDVCTTLQILLNFHKTDKNKKGARLTKSKLYGILMRKILFHDAKMIPKLSFFEHVPFLRQYVFFFLLMNEKHNIIFRSEALTQLLKTCLFYSRAIFRLLPDADHYDMQHMAVHRSCDWSRVFILCHR